MESSFKICQLDIECVEAIDQNRGVTNDSNGARPYLQSGKWEIGNYVNILTLSNVIIQLTSQSERATYGHYKTIIDWMSRQLNPHIRKKS
jgi:hypothetical protein